MDPVDESAFPRSPHRGMDLGVPAEVEEIVPVETVEEPERVDSRGSRMKGQALAELVVGEETTLLEEAGDDRPIAVRVPQRLESRARIERLGRFRDQRTELFGARLPQSVPERRPLSGTDVVRHRRQSTGLIHRRGGDRDGPLLCYRLGPMSESGHALPDLDADQVEGDPEAVEDAWLSRLAERPRDVDFFATTARLIAESGESEDQESAERVRFLLELLDDELEGRNAWDSRLELLRRTGDLRHPEPADRHEAIMTLLEERYGDRSSFEGLVETVGLHRAVEDIPKSWEKVESLVALLDRDEGTVVWLEGKGGGRVVETNVALERFKVDVVGVGVISVGFAAAPKLLEPVPEGHLARRAMEDPDELKSLKETDPAELVRLALKSASGPLTAGELRERLKIVVEDGEWSSLWAKARRDPRLIALPGGRQRYGWADSEEAAAASLADRFSDADLDEQLELLRVHAERDPELREGMIESLRESARRLARRDPARAYAIGAALRREGVEIEEEPFAPRRLLSSAHDPARLVSELEPGQRGEAYELLPEVDEEWPRHFRTALEREEDPRILDRLAERLVDHDATAFDTALADLLTRPRAHPAAFTWLAERAADSEELRDRTPLRLWQQILSALDDERFRPFRQRLEALVESGSTLPRLLPHLGPDQATRAREAVERAPGLESFQRQALVNAVDLRFPDLRRAEETPLYATPESIERKKEELTTILEEEIPANRRAIEEARAMGDLRENFEYKSARQRHEYLTSRAETLNRELSRARPIDLGDVDTSAVHVGTRAVLTADGDELELTILGPWESEPESGVLSHESELAQRLLGMTPDEEIEIRGRRYTLERVETIDAV